MLINYQYSYMHCDKLFCAIFEYHASDVRMLFHTSMKAMNCADYWDKCELMALYFLKHKLFKPIVSRVGVQILLFENKDQNILISIFFHGFTVCSIEVLFTIIQVWLQCCYFVRNPSHCLILHVIVCDSHLGTALSYRNKDHWNLFLSHI